MFSKFLHGKNAEALAAMEIQWKMEYAKASRKFQCKKKEEKKKGRPPLGQLNLNNLTSGLDLSKIARSVATTREGQRVHHRAAEQIEGEKKKKKVCFCLLFLIYCLHLYCIFIACLLHVFARFLHVRLHAIVRACVCCCLYVFVS